MSENEWTPKQLKFIDIKANPQDTRSNEEIATDMGYNSRTFYRWQNQDGFWDAVYNRAMFYLEGQLPDVIKSLATEAKAGNVNAIKLLLQHTGKLVEKLEIDHRVGVQVIVVQPEFDVTGKSGLKPRPLKQIV